MPLTQDDKSYLKTLLDTHTEVLQESIRGLNQNFTVAMGNQDDRMDQVDAKLDAIMEMLAFRTEMANLVRELRTKGIELDEKKIFVAPVTPR